jgi:hypothetical protein
MKIIKIVKYVLAFSLFVVLTSFRPVDKFSKLVGGESQIEIEVVND